MPGTAVKAVLFDLDGTLLDTITDLTTASNRMLTALGRPQRAQSEIHSLVGKGIGNLVWRCLSEGGAPASQEETDAAVTVFGQQYALVNGETATPYPGVFELLEGLWERGLEMAIVTNKATAFTLPLLEQFGIARYFGAVVCGDTLPVRKPDPAVIERACEQLGVLPAESLMIGDSANDSLSARAARARVLLVTYGYSEGAPVETLDCDGFLGNVLEVFDFLDRNS